MTSPPRPTGNGTADGSGTYSHGYLVTLTATPGAHWHFVSWTESGNGMSTDEHLPLHRDGRP